MLTCLPFHMNPNSGPGADTAHTLHYICMAVTGFPCMDIPQFVYPGGNAICFSSFENTNIALHTINKFLCEHGFLISGADT